MKIRGLITMEKFYSLCLQGNVLKALEYLRSITPRTEYIAEIEEKYNKRFLQEPAKFELSYPNQWINDVFSKYYLYFRSVLTNNDPIKAEIELSKSLLQLLPTDTYGSLDCIENKIKDMFRDEGYFFQGGITSPFWGPYIWKTMDSKHYHVELPNGIQTLNVHFMSDFIMQSWIEFATFGCRSVGGWAKEDAIYCNLTRYQNELDSENFTVSYLKHEAQHFNDYIHFPKLPGKDLEYRAKLIELIYSQSHRPLKKFLLEASSKPDLPHSYASYILLKSISLILFSKEHVGIDEWNTIDYKTIAHLALQLYHEHTDSLLSGEHNESQGVI